MPIPERVIARLRLRDHLAEFHVRRGEPDPGRWSWSLTQLIRYHRKLHRGAKSKHWHPKTYWWKRELRRRARAASGGGACGSGPPSSPLSTGSGAARVLEPAPS